MYTENILKEAKLAIAYCEAANGVKLSVPQKREMTEILCREALVKRSVNMASLFNELVDEFREKHRENPSLDFMIFLNEKNCQLRKTSFIIS